MAAYAAQDDVLARAGRFGGVFSVAGKRPNLADLDELLVTVAAIIDAEILARGYDPALLDATIEEALKDVNAWAVLVRALPQATPGDDQADAIVEQGREILKAAGFPSLAEGGSDLFTALAALEAGEGGGGAGTSAGSLWDDFADVEETRDAATVAEDAEPVWLRGQSL